VEAFILLTDKDGKGVIVRIGPSDDPEKWLSENGFTSKGRGEYSRPGRARMMYLGRETVVEDLRAILDEATTTAELKLQTY
jgi:hypothetical protein